MTAHPTTLTLGADGVIRVLEGTIDPSLAHVLQPGRPFNGVASVFSPSERARFGALVDLLAAHPGLGGGVRLLLDRPGQPGVALDIEPANLVESSRRVRWRPGAGESAMLPVAATWPPLVRALPIPAALAGAGGALRAVNQELCAVLGLDEDALVGMRWAGLAVPPDDTLAAAAHDALIDGLLDEATANLRLFHPDQGVIELTDRQIAVPGGVLSLIHVTPVTPVDALLPGEATAYEIALQGSPGFSPELAFRAFHDPLTGLPNRLLLLDRLEHALHRRGRRADEIAVLFCDLDGFKEVNDTLGHAAGDRLLSTVGERLRGVLRPSDTVARYGGDEFVLVCEDLHEGPSVADIARRVVESIERPIELDGVVTAVRVSIGVALAPEHLHDPEVLLQEADQDMYRVKQARRGDPSVGPASGRPGGAGGADASAITEDELRRALDAGEVVPFFQPQIDLTDGHLVALEALARWRHPRRGVLDASTFVDTAERLGLVTELGRRVLVDACIAGAGWQALARDSGGTPPVVSVNLSRTELTGDALIDGVRSALAESGLSAALLRVELSATIALAESAVATRVCSQLRALGVGLVVDDVGAELSELELLAELLPTEVKLDRPWVQALGRGRTEGRSTGAAVAGFARMHRISAAAEGVETEEEARQLGQQGYVLAQGYWFAAPQPAEAITRVIASDLRWRTV